MPINAGKEGESSYTGLTGNYQAKPTSVADKIVEGRDGRPDALRVVFEIKDHSETASLFVPLADGAADVLRPFLTGDEPMQTDEAYLRQFIATNVSGDWFLTYLSNGSVRGVTAAPGKHLIRLTGLNKFARQSDSVERVRFFAANADHETVTWTTNYPKLVTKVGDDPAQDDIGPTKELSPNQYLFMYCIDFGLDWERFVKEMTAAYEKGKLFSRLDLDGPVDGFFEDPNDITEELFQAVYRHNDGNPPWVQVEIVSNEKYGIGPKRGQFSKITLTPVVMADGGGASAQDNKARAAFKRELDRFVANWDLLTQSVLSKPDAAFLNDDGLLTDEGRSVAVGLLVPMVHAFPKASLIKKDDGSPATQIPPKLDGWHPDGLACANFLAERLVKLGEEELFQVANLSDKGASVVAWAAANVPEWKTIGMADGGDDLGEVL